MTDFVLVLAAIALITVIVRMVLPALILSVLVGWSMLSAHSANKRRAKLDREWAERNGMER